MSSPSVALLKYLGDEVLMFYAEAKSCAKQDNFLLLIFSLSCTPCKWVEKDFFFFNQYLNSTDNSMIYEVFL